MVQRLRLSHTRRPRREEFRVPFTVSSHYVRLMLDQLVRLIRESKDCTVSCGIRICFPFLPLRHNLEDSQVKINFGHFAVPHFSRSVSVVTSLDVS